MRKTAILIAILVVVILAAFAFFWDQAIAPDATPSPSTAANITVESPRSGDKVGNPILVTGQARVFESTFAYGLRDLQGKKLYENHAMTEAEDIGLFGNYTVKIPVPVSAPKNVVVEVWEYSAKDGSVINLVRVPVELASQEKAKVNVYFSNNLLDPQQTCTKTFPVERQIYKTVEVGYVALAELLAGPSVTDRNAGFATNIPEGVRINSLRIQNGTAYADFNETLESGVAGSCRVQAIRSQIENTLKQFPSVQNVVISVNGRTQDILQP